ncbi:MAG: DUF1269 domain-containing protein [Chloroflexaceae bacterium]|nr:DUF1269 domain-containing protein [Chloroflexaceae bacterium]
MTTAPLDLIVLAYTDATTADTVLHDLQSFQKKGIIRLVNAAVIVKDKQGNTSIKETEDVDAAHGRCLVPSRARVIGLIGGPFGALIGAAAGAATGGASAHLIDMGFPDEQLKRLQEKLVPDSSALVALVENIWVERFYEALEETATAAQAEVLQTSLEESITRQLQQRSTNSDENSNKPALSGMPAATRLCLRPAVARADRSSVWELQTR